MHVYIHKNLLLTLLRKYYIQDLFYIIKTNFLGGGYGSVEHMPSIHEGPNSIPDTFKKRNKTMIFLPLLFPIKYFSWYFIISSLLSVKIYKNVCTFDCTEKLLILIYVRYSHMIKFLLNSCLSRVS